MGLDLAGLRSIEACLERTGADPGALAELHEMVAAPLLRAERQAMAVRVVDRLVASGAPLADACKQVAKALRQCPGFEGTIGKQVEELRERVRQGARGRASRATIESYDRLPPPYLRDRPPQEQARMLCAELAARITPSIRDRRHALDQEKGKDWMQPYKLPPRLVASIGQ